MAETICNAEWVRKFMTELGQKQAKPTTVYQDKLGTISWTEEVQGLEKCKRICIKYYYLREMVVHKSVEVIYKPSADNLADTFNKVLIGPTFHVQQSP